jgi:hypothetical protein
VQRAKFPIAAACRREEFEDWLRRARNVRLLVRRDEPKRAKQESALPLNEIAQRSAADARSLTASARSASTGRLVAAALFERRVELAPFDAGNGSSLRSPRAQRAEKERAENAGPLCTHSPPSAYARNRERCRNESSPIREDL